jgi:hypothetical protein
MFSVSTKFPDLKSISAARADHGYANSRALTLYSAIQAQ